MHSFSMKYHQMLNKFCEEKNVENIDVRKNLKHILSSLKCRSELRSFSLSPKYTIRKANKKKTKKSLPC